MAKIRKRQLDLLRPYLVGEEPKPDGEWDMFCPLHQDSKRSAGINLEKGAWYCQAGCGGGRISELFAREEGWVPPPGRNGGSPKPASQKVEVVTEARVAGWQAALADNEPARIAFMERRGLTQEALLRWQIGWDTKYQAYTIPVADADGTWVSVRRYQLDPKDERRKIWSYGAMRLYPVAEIAKQPKRIIVCEGELDALLTIQHGYPAVSGTGGAKKWSSTWSQLFKGMNVWLAGDADETGQAHNRVIGRALKRVAAEVRVLTLPYPVIEKHGKDLTDFWMEYDLDEFELMMETAPLFGSKRSEPEALDPADASVLDSFDSRQVGKPVRLTVTIKGKREPGYSVPRKVNFECTTDAGAICLDCPMNACKGQEKNTIDKDDPIVLEMMEATKPQLDSLLRHTIGAKKCGKLNIEVEEHQAVEILYARPSVDHTTGMESGDYKNMKLTSIGRHDTLPNNTVQVVGSLQPDPRKQLNEFMAWEVNSVETSLDNFEGTQHEISLMKRFRPRGKQRPIRKLADIARDMSDHVTSIYGRTEYHAALDLCYHSALAFDFDGKRISRGWLELLVVGDTRTGKSEAAQKLIRHYQAGEMVSCESSSFAGIVGGLQQYGSGKEWAINWGVIPINDRRMVILDEVSGLSTEEIAQMSSVRSAGEAQLTKIQQDKTFARTRLIWLGNPRNGRMADYTYGVQAIQPLIGNMEDIARFDFAMCLMAGEVASEEINRVHVTGELKYTREACQTLVRWVWSRTPDQIVWGRGAENEVYKAANKLGSKYVEDPPLIQAANAREKVARLAVALAARLFSSDDSFECIVVNKDHVQDAVKFLDILYQMPNFGYGELSKERILDTKEAQSSIEEMRKFLKERKGLPKFLRGRGKFRRQDLEEVLDISRDQANSVISTLYDSRMVRKDKGDIVIEPTLHKLLREVKI